MPKRMSASSSNRIGVGRDIPFRTKFHYIPAALRGNPIRMEKTGFVRE